MERITVEIARRFSPPEPPEDKAHFQPEGSERQEVSSDFCGQDLPLSKQGLSWEKAVLLLVSIPGISERAASGIRAEIGVNMQQFPTASHLASWVGVCPGNHESAGKRLSGKTRHPAIPGYVASCCKRLMSSPARSRAFWLPYFIAVRPDEEKNVPHWRSLTVSW